MALTAGRVLGDYTLRQRLDAGGQGEVWDASSRSGPVALKILRPQQTGANGKARERFRRELRAALSVRSSSVARVVDWDVDHDPAWIAYERIVGVTLAQHLREHEVQPALADALRILADVAEGLTAIHAQGLTHCDVKPQNVMVLRRGGAIVLDLGAVTFGDGSELSREGFGTEGWRAPEQGVGTTTPASDLYAFGLLSVKTLTGHMAYSGEFPFGEDPDLRGLPVAVADLVLGCLQARPAKRPSAAELCAQLRALQDALDQNQADAADAAAREKANSSGRPHLSAYERDRATRRQVLVSNDWQRVWPVLTRMRSVVEFDVDFFGTLHADVVLDPTPLWGTVITHDQSYPYPRFAAEDVPQPLRLGDWYELTGMECLGSSDEVRRVVAHLAAGPRALTPFGRQPKVGVALPAHCPVCGTGVVRRRERDQARSLYYAGDLILGTTTGDVLKCPAHETCPRQLDYHVHRLAAALLGYTQDRCPFGIGHIRPLLEATGVESLSEIFAPGLPELLRDLDNWRGVLLAEALEAATDVSDLDLLLALGMPRGVVSAHDFNRVDQVGRRAAVSLAEALDIKDSPPEPKSTMMTSLTPDLERRMLLHTWVVEDNGWRLPVLQAALRLRNDG